MLAAQETAYGNARKVRLWVVSSTEWAATATVPSCPPMAVVALNIPASIMNITLPTGGQHRVVNSRRPVSYLPYTSFYLPHKQQAAFHRAK
jgi:hypothetical protein